MRKFQYIIPLATSVMLVGCSGSSTPETAETVEAKKVPDTTTPAPAGIEIPAAPAAPTLTLTFAPTKAFRFTWVAVTGATSYKLTEAVTNESGYELVKEVTATSFDHIVPLYARLNAKYILQSCNAGGCTASAEVFTMARVAEMKTSIGYFKANNAGENDEFGTNVSLSADGNTLAVGSIGEDSNSLVINEGEDDNSAPGAGAVYVFTRDNTSAAWSAQAYLKADNAGGTDVFGASVSLSADGNTLAVGAKGEDGAEAEAGDSGAAYVFIRSGITWSQQAYLKASNADANDEFGSSVSLSADGSTLAVGAEQESSDATTIEGDEDNNNTKNSGAVYIFARTDEESDTTWPQQAYLKASNASAEDKFGSAISLSENGNTLAVGVRAEGSNNQEGDNDLAKKSGAVYVFARTLVDSNTKWSEQAYLKASNSNEYDQFGNSVSISADGNTLAVGAVFERSNAKGTSGDKTNNDAVAAGAVYVFIRKLEAWSEQAYLKASNTDEAGYDSFGHSVSISADGNLLAVGAVGENRNAIGINGDSTNKESVSSGAVHTYTRSATTWFEQAYLKAGITDGNDQFGRSVALSADGGTLAVGANGESSNATKINADQKNNGATDAGAVYLY